MVVFGSVIILIIISMVLLGISGRMSTFRQGRSEITFIKTEACLEETLIQLSRDHNYTGGSYTIDQLDCDVAVNASGDERTLYVDGTEEDYNQHFIVRVQIEPTFVILDFSY